MDFQEAANWFAGLFVKCEFCKSGGTKVEYSHGFNYHHKCYIDVVDFPEAYDEDIVIKAKKITDGMIETKSRQHENELRRRKNIKELHERKMKLDELEEEIRKLPPLHKR